MIVGKEKKFDYGQIGCSFVMEAFLDTDDYIFATINKPIGNGKYKPVFKSECKVKHEGSISWNHINSDTDSLADSDESFDLMV